MKKVVNKIILTVLLSGVLLLQSCDNFSDGGTFKDELGRDIAYAKAKSISVAIMPKEGTGTALPSGLQTVKLGYPFSVSFKPVESLWYFTGWKAVLKSAPEENLTDVVFEDPLSTDTKVYVNADLDGIMIIPECTDIIRASDITPKGVTSAVSRDRPVTVNFSKEPSPKSFIFEESEIPENAVPVKNEKDEILSYTLDGSTYFKNILITDEDGVSLAEHFYVPAIEGKLLTLIPDRQNPVMLSEGQNQKKINITLLKEISDKSGICMESDVSWSYSVNRTTDEKAYVTVESVSGSSASAGTLKTASQSYSLGIDVSLEIEVNADFQFVRWEYDSSVIYVEKPLEPQTRFRALDSTSETEPTVIRAVCSERPRINFILESSNGKLSPSKGSYDCIDTYTYHLSFEPDNDYEFIRWKIYDSRTNAEIQNGTYITIENPLSEDTSYWYSASLRGNYIQLAVCPEVAERPQVISRMPQSSGILKDSSVQVLFDRDMAPASIYYTESEVIELKRLGVQNDDFLPPLKDTEIPGSLLNHYGYTKDGKTWFKNILLTDNKTGENINDKFAEPFFENKRTLSIPAGKVSGHIIDDYVQVLVTIEKEFFYSVKIDAVTTKRVTMRGNEKWMYQVNDKVDVVPLKFATKKIDENNTETLFSVKVSEDGSELKTPSAITGTLDYNKISSLDFIKNENLYFDLKLQEPEGSGPLPYFTAVLKRIYDENYNSVSSEEIEKDIYYDAVTADDAKLKGSADLSDLNLSDGVYELYFKFCDRSGNDFIWPKQKEPKYHIAKDETPVSPKGVKLSSADSSNYTLSWTSPNEKDYKEAVISWGNGTDNKTVIRGTNQDVFEVSKESIFDITVIFTDYAGNSKEESIPVFLTGYEFDATPSFAKYEVPDVFFSGDNFSDYSIEKTVAYWSDGTTTEEELTVITNSPSNNGQNITDICLQNNDERIDISKSAKLGDKKYYVAAAGAKPTATPVKLTDYSEGSLAGGNYYAFGDFPQTISSISSYSSEPVYNGWYLGSNGYFYEKCAEHGGSSSDKYSNGTSVGTNGSYKYFKVEPVVWRQLSGVFLFSEKALTVMKFYDNRTERNTQWEGRFYPNNWIQSKIRAYLNGRSYYDGDASHNAQYDTSEGNKGFLQTAFTAAGQKRIQETGSSTSAWTTQPALHRKQWWNGDNPCAVDASYSSKIFLLSTNEATDPDYGFPDYNIDYYTNSSRVRKPTDYALANGANYSYLNGKTSYGCRWWLRSPWFVHQYDPYTKIRYIGDGGNTADDFGEFVNSALGVVPALRVSNVSLLE